MDLDLMRASEPDFKGKKKNIKKMDSMPLNFILSLHMLLASPKSGFVHLK